MWRWRMKREATERTHEALLDYLSDMCSFWEGDAAPGELRGKDLFCAVDALKKGDWEGALEMVESAEKRARVIPGVRAK
jgi:hypothetical protein